MCMREMSCLILFRSLALRYGCGPLGKGRGGRGGHEGTQLPPCLSSLVLSERRLSLSEGGVASNLLANAIGEQPVKGWKRTGD